MTGLLVRFASEHAGNSLVSGEIPNECVDRPAKSGPEAADCDWFFAMLRSTTK
jgi:hypothetical protein